MTETCFDLPQGGFFCLNSGRIQQVTDSQVDLIHCILSSFDHWILEFEIYL
jgi:Tfp pilus assembly protein PilP